MWLRPDKKLTVEVKTRAEEAAYSEKALSRTLDRARSQLPKGGVAGVFVKIPTPWLRDGNYRRNHADVVANFLRRTSRVQIVVLVWDVWRPKTFGNGWEWSRGVRMFRSDSQDPIVAGLMDFYDRAWKMPQDLGPNAPF